VLALDVFGWTDPGPRWWENARLALTSPLTIACRYESEPFWCNEHGIHLRQQNAHIAALDLADFCKRAMTEAAIVVPIHLPFGEIAAVSFNPKEPERTDLSAEFAQHCRHARALGASLHLQLSESARQASLDRIRRATEQARGAVPEVGVSRQDRRGDRQDSWDAAAQRFVFISTTRP
jgi:hypothetical protein